MTVLQHLLCSGVLQAIKLNGAVLGLYPLRVMQSKTAIVPVNTEFLPRTQARAGLVCSMGLRAFWKAQLHELGQARNWQLVAVLRMHTGGA